KAGTEVQVAVKQRMVSDLPEVAVGDLTLPVLRRTLADALVEHTQGSLELVRENGLEVVDHGTHSCVSLPPAAERQGYAAGAAWKKVRPHPRSVCALSRCAPAENPKAEAGHLEIVHVCAQQSGRIFPHMPHVHQGRLSPFRFDCGHKMGGQPWATPPHSPPQIATGDIDQAQLGQVGAVQAGSPEVGNY